jgi:hypothetical protein
MKNPFNVPLSIDKLERASRMPLVALLYPEQCVIGQLILFILVGEMRTDVSKMVTGAVGFEAEEEDRV